MNCKKCNSKETNYQQEYIHNRNAGTIREMAYIHCKDCNHREFIYDIFKDKDGKIYDGQEIVKKGLLSN